MWYFLPQRRSLPLLLSQIFLSSSSPVQCFCKFFMPNRSLSSFRIFLHRRISFYDHSCQNFLPSEEVVDRYATTIFSHIHIFNYDRMYKNYTRILKRYQQFIIQQYLHFLQVICRTKLLSFTRIGVFTPLMRKIQISIVNMKHLRHIYRQNIEHLDHSYGNFYLNLKQILWFLF